MRGKGAEERATDGHGTRWGRQATPSPFSLFLWPASRCHRAPHADNHRRGRRPPTAVGPDDAPARPPPATRLGGDAAAARRRRAHAGHRRASAGPPAARGELPTGKTPPALARPAPLPPAPLLSPPAARRPHPPAAVDSCTAVRADEGGCGPGLAKGGWRRRPPAARRPWIRRCRLGARGGARGGAGDTAPCDAAAGGAAATTLTSLRPSHCQAVARMHAGGGGTPPRERRRIGGVLVPRWSCRCRRVCSGALLVCFGRT